MTLFEELKRRNVFRVGIAYAIVSWLVLQVADVMIDNLDAPDWLFRTILLILLIGFPLALFFAWAFELTPEGLKRESEVDRSESITPKTGRKLDFAIIGVLTLALAYFAVDKFVLRDSADTVSDRVAVTEAGAEGEITVADEPAILAQDSSATPAPEKSIAVLPFVNLSSDPEQEYFSDGISEELLNVLAQYPDLRVAARTSSFQFKNHNQDIGEIADLLKVRHVLEGSVRKSGNQLRITAQLIEAENGYHLWSQTYDRELKDVFAIQDEISAAIGEALRVELALNDVHGQAIPQVAESESTAAYEAFLKGRGLIALRGRRNITDGVDELERSVRLDPEYAPAHAWLAIGISLLRNSPSSYGDYTHAEVEELARPHLERALELDPNLAAAHGARALMANGAGDFAVGQAAADRAVELNPVFVDAINWGQLASQAMGDMENAVVKIESLIVVDPLSVVGRLNYIGMFARSRSETSEALARSLKEQSPWAGYVGMSFVEGFGRQDLSKALEWNLRAYAESPLDDFSNRQLIFLFSMLGELEEARRISDLSGYIADIYAGHHETVVDTLQQRFEQDPENFEAQVRLADAYYLNGDLQRAEQLYRLHRDSMPSGLVYSGDNGSVSHARMVWTMTQNGDVEEARSAAELFRNQVRRSRALEIDYEWDDVAEAMIAMSERDEGTALEALRTAREEGLFDVTYFDDPAFARLQSNPEFLSIRAEVQQAVDQEHQEALQLICFNNPIPSSWEPLAATCEGFQQKT